VVLHVDRPAPRRRSAARAVAANAHAFSANARFAEGRMSTAPSASSVAWGSGVVLSVSRRKITEITSTPTRGG
jgi:hypothetical protein